MNDARSVLSSVITLLESLFSEMFETSGHACYGLSHKLTGLESYANVDTQALGDKVCCHSMSPTAAEPESWDHILGCTESIIWTRTRELVMPGSSLEYLNVTSLQ